MFEISVATATALGLAFTLVGALVGALASVYAARVTAHRQQLYVASATFRAAFVEELIGLRTAEEDAFKTLSDTALAKHRKAKVEFEPWVPRPRMAAFDLAWSEYERSVKTVAPGNLNNRRQECLASLARIEVLLGFARHDG